MRVTVKICGLTSAADAGLAVQAGADLIGFLFDPASPRWIGGEGPVWVHGAGGATKVGVFRNQGADEVARMRDRAGLDLVQLHGDEPPEMCAALGGRNCVVKAIHVAGEVDWVTVRRYAAVARILFDTASRAGGGTGRTFDWDVLAAAPADLRFWLAGGLTPENVAAALARARPTGVDVASGVESRVRVKDPDKMRRFVAAVRAAENSGQAGTGRGR